MRTLKYDQKVMAEDKVALTQDKSSTYRTDHIYGCDRGNMRAADSFQTSLDLGSLFGAWLKVSALGLDVLIVVSVAFISETGPLAFMKPQLRTGSSACGRTRFV